MDGAPDSAGSAEESGGVNIEETQGTTPDEINTDDDSKDANNVNGGEDSNAKSTTAENNGQTQPESGGGN